MESLPTIRGSAFPKYLSILAVLFISSAGNFKAPPSATTPDTVAHMAPDSIVQLASQLEGVRYRYGGTDLKGFDCSGFTSFVYKMYDIVLPRSSREQYRQCRKICDEQIRKADLLFFKGRNAAVETVGHVGIAISNWRDGNVLFIHASRHGVKVDSLGNPYYKRRFIGAGRTLSSLDIQKAKPLPPGGSGEMVKWRVWENLPTERLYPQ